MRSVVSVSMAPELAAELKKESEDIGTTFSAYVCELLERGRGVDVISAEEFKEAQNDPEVKAILAEADSLFRKTEPDPPSGTPTERVYSAIDSEQRSISAIAELAGVSTEEALDIVDKLTEEGEPINIKAISSEWFCWRSDNQ